MLTGIVACFAAAYTINIGNQESYGTLNLGKLLLWRSSGAGTWIEIDWSGYTIKVWTRAGTQATSQIYVSEICGRTWDNCKPVSELMYSNNLSSWWYCKYVGETLVQKNGQWVVETPAHFECTTTNPYTLPLAGNGTTWWIKLWYSTWSNGEKTYPIVLDSDGKAYVLVPWEDTHYTGTLTIKWGNTAAITFSQSGGAQYLTITWGGDISVTANDWTITVSGSDTNTHYTGTLTIKWGGKTGIVFYQSGNATLNITWGGGITVTTGSSSGTIIISGAAGGWDGLWSESTDKTIIRPTDETDNVMIWRNGNRKHYIQLQGSWSYYTPTSAGCWVPESGGQLIWFSNKLLFNSLAELK